MLETVPFNRVAFLSSTSQSGQEAGAAPSLHFLYMTDYICAYVKNDESVI